MSNIVWSYDFPFSPNKLSKIYNKSIGKNFITIGYVVNIYDPLNYDIDLILDADQMDTIINAEKKIYKYDEYDEDFNKIQKEGSIYRCRISEIGVNRKKYPNLKKDPINYKIKTMIDNFDGWVICNVLGVDECKRVLIDLFLYKEKKYKYKKKLIKTNQCIKLWDVNGFINPIKLIFEEKENLEFIKMREFLLDNQMFYYYKC